MTNTRTEHDSLGPVEVDAQRQWGAQTQRALQNFRISTERMPAELIHALALVKRAGALANRDLGVLAPEVADAIAAAAREVEAGRRDDEFPLPVWQTGSGTQTHMNMNEVLARLAAARLAPGTIVHPNDHVGRGQSSNDIFPTALHVAAALAVQRRLLPALTEMHADLAAKAQEYADLVKVGRTHLQDATPITLGQEFSGYAAQIAHARRAIEATLPAVHELAAGGTAVGTGINTHPEFGTRVAAILAAETGLALTTAPNKFAALAAHDALVALHGALKTLAVALMKIANDLRWLASGPRCGLGELTLPANEPGSSIMPGKVNPTQCEMLTMVCCQVIGNDVALSLGGASGHFELNTFKPLIAHNLLQSLRLLSDGCASFTAHALHGLTPNPGRMAEMLANSLMLVTALTPHIGYDHAARIAQKAQAEGMALRDAAMALGCSAQDFDAWVQPRNVV